ncbi:MAG: hypothetical protein JWO88_3939 [Frankiales bacterium]|nr:hypothetical protein [Frankiales bacterium]
MRKQYHFRPSDSGLRAWDVDNLIRLTQDQPEELIPLSAIGEIDENWWFAFRDEPTVRSVVAHFQLMEQIDLTHPVILDPDGRLMDGMHRVAKALSEGAANIRAKRLRTLPVPDFVGVAPSDLPYE